MKKIILTLLVMAFAANAYAAAPSRLPKGFNATKNVTVVADKNANGDAFAVASKHASGDKQYATTSGFGGVAQQTVATSATPTAPTAPTSPTDSTVPDGYTSM